ncbi:MAG TPA: VOC family protein [Kofleriaceae bacterium]|jgi:uncharacterized glyoxalase superfamily protein PhnB
MKPTPSDWPRISASLIYKEPLKAIEWLGKAFGFEPRLVVEHDGIVAHSELVYGEAVIMVSSEDRPDRPESCGKSPVSLGGATTGSLMVYVDDCDAHCERARAAGATITGEPSVHDYGEEYWADRSYGCRDVEGHQWWFAQRLRSRS